MKMELIQADFNIVTPMFLGEADGQCASQIRPPAIKGALRFWWRALNWAPIRRGYRTDAEALVELHKQEADLFGRSAKTGLDGKKQIGGQGMFLFRVSEQKVSRSTDNNFVVKENLPALAYLLGQGLYEHENKKKQKPAKITRNYLPGRGSFTLKLALKSGQGGINASQKQQLLDVLTCFGLLGCLGSRARKGFGSVSIKKLTLGDTEQPLPKDEEAYKTQLKELLGKCFELQTEPPLTAFSDLSRIQIGGRGKSAMELLSDHGYEMGMYRGYGNSGQTFNQKAEQNFQQDHDWAYAIANGKGQTYLPKRTAFGLPHPYFLSSIKRSVAVDVDNGNGRRASPLFGHVHELPSGQYLLIHLVLQSQFLPSNTAINVKGSHQGARFNMTGQKVSADIDWKVLDDFLKRFNPTDKDIIHGR